MLDLMQFAPVSLTQRSHRKDSAAKDSWDLVCIQGNRAADDYAKTGAKMHGLFKRVAEDYQRVEDKVMRIARHIGACLAL